MEIDVDHFSRPTDWEPIRIRRINVTDEPRIDPSRPAIDFEIEVHCSECKKPATFRVSQEVQGLLDHFFRGNPPEQQRPSNLAIFVGMQLGMTAFHAICPACRPVQIVTPTKKILKP